jgi:hypothetical protein
MPPPPPPRSMLPTRSQGLGAFVIVCRGYFGGELLRGLAPLVPQTHAPTIFHHRRPLPRPLPGPFPRSRLPLHPDPFTFDYKSHAANCYGAGYWNIRVVASITTTREYFASRGIDEPWLWPNQRLSTPRPIIKLYKKREKGKKGKRTDSRGFIARPFA